MNIHHCKDCVAFSNGDYCETYDTNTFPETIACSKFKIKPEEPETLESDTNVDKEESPKEADKFSTATVTDFKPQPKVRQINADDDDYEEVVDESSWHLPHIFSFSGRLRRTEYGISMIVYWIICQILGLIAPSLRSGVELACYWIILIFVIWFGLAQGAKRCHDRNNNGLWQFIPFYGLWMLFGDGDPYENDYGPDPKGRDIYAD